MSAEWNEPIYADTQRLVADDGEIVATIKFDHHARNWLWGMKSYISAEYARLAAVRGIKGLE